MSMFCGLCACACVHPVRPRPARFYFLMARPTVGARLRSTLAGGQPSRPERIAVLLATKSYPYLYGMGDRMCIEWHTEAAVESIFQFVISELQQRGCRVDVYAAVEEADGLKQLCDELFEHGVNVVKCHSDPSTHFFLRCQDACRSLGLLEGGYDYFVMLRPDLLFDGPLDLNSWSPSAVSLRARTLRGSRPPADAHLLSWWDASSFAHSPTPDNFVPDDQLFIVPRACADAFTRTPTPEETEFMQKAANGATFGMEVQLGALMRHRGVELSCTPIPCVLMKHAALKARYGRNELQPMCVYRAEPNGETEEDY